jgi:hypothetical protein
VIQIGNALRGVRPWRGCGLRPNGQGRLVLRQRLEPPPSCARARGQGRARTWPVRSISGREYRSVRVSHKSLPGRCFFRPAICQPQRTDHAAVRRLRRHRRQLIRPHLRKARGSEAPAGEGTPTLAAFGRLDLDRVHSLPPLCCAVAAREWGCRPCQWLSSVRRYRVPSEQICIVTDSGG